MKPDAPFKNIPVNEGPVWSVAGDVYTILISSDESGGACTLIEGRTPPHGGPPPHIHHREDEAFYVIEGDMDFTCDGQSIRCGPGSFIHLPRGTLHFFRNAGHKTARMLIHCIPGGLDRYFEEVGQRLPHRNAPPVPVTDADIKKLVALAPKYGLDIKVPAGR